MPTQEELDAVIELLGFVPWATLPHSYRLDVMKIAIAARQADALQRIATCESVGYFDIRAS